MAYPQQGVIIQQPQMMVIQQPQVIYIQPQIKFWKQEMNSAMCDQPGIWCEACFCPHCVMYRERIRLIAFLGEPNSCCLQDSLPRYHCCDPPTMPPYRAPPAVWPPIAGQEPLVMKEFQWDVCCEVTFCIAPALMANRRLMQWKFWVHETDCDRCCFCCCVGAAIVSVGAPHRHRSSGWLHAALACIQTQQIIQLQEEEKNRIQIGYIPLLGAPAPQQMMTSPGSPVYTNQQPVVYQQQQVQQYPQQQQQYPQQQTML